MILADTRPPAASLPPAAGARPLIEVVTVRDPIAGRLLEGVWLVDDLSAVDHGVAVTRAGEGIDADRGELWRTGDAGEAAWMAARAERDRLADEDAAVAAAHGAAVAAADVAAADRRSRRPRRRRGPDGARRPAGARGGSGRGGTGVRGPARPHDRRGRPGRGRARGGRARSGRRGPAAGRSSSARRCGSRRPQQARVAAAQTADQRHAELDIRRRELADAAARLAAQEAGLRERAERFRHDADRLRSTGERARATSAESRRMAATARALEERGRSIGRALVRIAAAAELLRTPARAGVAVIERRSGELAAELQACAHDEAAVQANGAHGRGDGHRDRGRAHPLHRPHRRARPQAGRDRGRRAARPRPR